ncbi:MAG: hypothetical protein IBX43_00905 [Campylobacterales bacterium]|nr:hypothetical protein [Campylobacterales bacterium]
MIENENISVRYTKNETAVRVLERAVDVKIRRVGRCSSVASINEVASRPNEMGWLIRSMGQKPKRRPPQQSLRRPCACSGYIVKTTA